MEHIGRLWYMTTQTTWRIEKEKKEKEKKRKEEN